MFRLPQRLLRSDGARGSCSRGGRTFACASPPACGRCRRGSHGRRRRQPRAQASNGRARAAGSDGHVRTGHGYRADRATGASTRRSPSRPVSRAGTGVRLRLPLPLRPAKPAVAQDLTRFAPSTRQHAEALNGLGVNTFRRHRRLEARGRRPYRRCAEDPRPDRAGKLDRAGADPRQGRRDLLLAPQAEGRAADARPTPDEGERITVRVPAATARPSRSPRRRPPQPLLLLLRTATLKAAAAAAAAAVQAHRLPSAPRPAAAAVAAVASPPPHTAVAAVVQKPRRPGQHPAAPVRRRMPQRPPSRRSQRPADRHGAR